MTAPPDPKVKPYRDQTWTEKWLTRRDRWLRVMPVRLNSIDAGFNLLMQVTDRDGYEPTKSEAAALVAYLQAWVDTVDQSLKAGKKLPPGGQMPIILDHDVRPPEDAIPVPAGLEDIW